jgi:hypothetical protein
VAWDRPVCEQYPSLYRVVNRYDVSVAHVMGVTPLNIGLGLFFRVIDEIDGLTLLLIL